MLEPVAKDIWIARAPLVFLGLHLGTKMTVVRLPSGELWVHSPVAMGKELRAHVDALGDVRHVVAPNLFHHLFVKEWQNAYPKATLNAPAGLAGKRTDLRVDVGLEGAGRAAWSKELVPVHIDGCMLDETVFVHPASRTVVSADLAENFATSPHWLTKSYLKAAGIYGKPGWSRFLRFLYRDREAARRSLDELLRHDFDRLVLAHGEVIPSGAKGALTAAYAFLG